MVKIEPLELCAITIAYNCELKKAFKQEKASLYVYQSDKCEYIIKYDNNLKVVRINLVDKNL